LFNGIKNLQSQIELQQVVPTVDKYLHVTNRRLNTGCSQKWLFIYLFIFALTNNHVSISDYITSTDRVICRQQTQRIWKRAAVAMLEIYRTGRNDGNPKVFNYYSRYPGITGKF